MLKYLLSACLLAASAGVHAAAAGPVPHSDSAEIEAYRRLPFCRLAPDGRQLAEQPCRRPPTRSFAQRRDASNARPAPEHPAATVAAPRSALLIPPVAPPVVPPAPRAVQPPMQPLNQCGIAGCLGANGVLYQQGAGAIVLDPSGRMCTRHGQWVQCQ